MVEQYFQLYVLYLYHYNQVFDTMSDDVFYEFY